MILLVYKKTYFNTNNIDSFIPSVVISLWPDFEDDIGQSNLDLSLICPTTQLYTNKHNFLFNYTKSSWNFAKSLQRSFFLSWLKFQVDHSLLRLSNKGSKLFSRFCYIFPNDIHSGLPLINDTINNSMVKYGHHIPRLDDIFNECLNLFCLVRLI
jgi:hypothetical protein